MVKLQINHKDVILLIMVYLFVHKLYLLGLFKRIKFIKVYVSFRRRISLNIIPL